MEVDLERRVLAANDERAGANRADWAGRGLFVINLISSPGAGKTTLLEKTCLALRDELRVGVIEGDLQTSLDAERLAALGVPAVQINTRGGCHLDAAMVSRAAQALDLDELDLLVIENVGNLVCPAEFDLGEAAKVVLLSTPEGQDKPAKYPLIFRLSQALVITKMDLLPHLPFDLTQARAEALKIQPGLAIFEVAALTGAGLESWLGWLRAGVKRARERARR